MKRIFTTLLLSILVMPAWAQLPEVGDSVRVVLEEAVLVPGPWGARRDALVSVPVGSVLHVDAVEADANYFYASYEGTAGWMHSGYVAVVWRGGQRIDAPKRVGTEPQPMIASAPLSVYPNPAAGRVTIEGEGTVYDALGRELGRYGDQQATFRPGVYFLRSDDGRVQRFVVI